MAHTEVWSHQSPVPRCWFGLSASLNERESIGAAETPPELRGFATATTACRPAAEVPAVPAPRLWASRLCPPRAETPVSGLTQRLCEGFCSRTWIPSCVSGHVLPFYWLSWVRLRLHVLWNQGTALDSPCCAAGGSCWCRAAHTSG